MAAYITVLNYVYSLCVFYYNVLSCVADVADCPLQRLSAIVIKNIIIIIITSFSSHMGPVGGADIRFRGPQPDTS